MPSKLILITAEQARDLYEIGTPIMHRNVHMGEVPATNVEKRWWFRPSFFVEGLESLDDRFFIEVEDE